MYATLPGELAPKVAMAQAAESAGDIAVAAHWYDIVSATDPGFTGAVFGLARCRVAMGDLDGAVAAYDRIPSIVELVRRRGRWPRPRRCSTGGARP